MRGIEAVGVGVVDLCVVERVDGHKQGPLWKDIAIDYLAALGYYAREKIAGAGIRSLLRVGIRRISGGDRCEFRTDFCG